MRKLLLVLLIGLAVAVALPVAAQEGPYADFCAGDMALAADSLPAEAPCDADGVYATMRPNNVLKLYVGYDTVLGFEDLEEVWFIPGEVGEITAQPLSGPEAGAPEAWTEAVCRGDAALVYQSPDETGDGVTVSLLDNWGCSEESALLLIEPWGSFSNADAACWVPNWEAAGEFAERLDLWNGSVWVVSDDLVDHPMVVDCADVTDGDSMGLNPNENQISPERTDWMQNHSVELLNANNMTLEADYCPTFGSEPLARLICPRTNPLRRRN